MKLEACPFTIVPAKILAASPQLLPEAGGVYVFLLQPQSHWPEGFGAPRLFMDWDGHACGALYVGATQDSLLYRVKQHLKPNSASSTMRMSLGLLMQNQLGLEVIPHSRKRYFWFEDEAPLSEWLFDNTLVAFRACDDALAVEARLHINGSGLLNISQAPQTDLSRRLLQLRDHVAGPVARRRMATQFRLRG